MISDARLNHLLVLRDRVDAEIVRERNALRRATKLRDDTLAYIGNPSGWLDRVLAAAAAAYSVDPEVIPGRDNTPDARNARHVACWLLHEAGRSYLEIGRNLNRDHSTVMHSVRRVSTDDSLAAVAHQVRARLLADASRVGVELTREA